MPLTKKQLNYWSENVPKFENKEVPSHQLKGDSIAKVETVRSYTDSFMTYIKADVPPSRERSLALTKLEEAMFWANAAIARNQED